MRWFRRFLPSPSMVIASAALLLVLGGTGYAAVQALPANSVTTVQVKDHSLLARDFKRGQLPRGPVGPVGPAGATGPAGPAGPAGSGASVRWALVRPDGGIAAQSGGIALGAHPGAGNYILTFASAVSGHPILTSGAYAGDVSDQRGETTAGPCGGGGGEGRTCPTGFDTNTHLFVQTRNSAALPADHAFYIVVFG